MFNFICGLGLGTFDSSRKNITLPIAENVSQNASGESLYVNTQNGNLHIEQEDLMLSGLGLDLFVRRFYNAQSEGNPWEICATWNCPYQTGPSNLPFAA